LVRSTRDFFLFFGCNTLIDRVIFFGLCSGLPNLPFCYRVLRRSFSQRWGRERQRYVPQLDGRNVCIFQHFDQVDIEI
jgi:hypothetical protein